MNSRSIEIEKLKGFFKKGRLNDIKSLDEILEIDLESLMGVSPIHADNLANFEIRTIGDLAQISEVQKIDYSRQIRDLPETLLEKWTRICTMLFDFATKSKERKIILLGLDNAGKTSILSILQNKFSIIKNLLPTRGVSRQTLDFLGTAVIVWDFGGQIAYREMYLSKPELFLESDLLIFCVDILDIDRYDESLEYLFDLMDKIKSISKEIPIIIDLHKFDPDVQNSEDLLKKRAEIIDKIATHSLESGFQNTAFINTTIFIKETVEELFSLAVQKMATSTSMVEYILKEYMEKTSAKALTLMTNQNLILGSCSMDSKRLENVAMQTGLLMQALVKFYESAGLKKEDEYFIYLTANNLCLRTVKILSKSDSDYSLFLWAVFEGEEVQFVDIEQFKKSIEPILDLF
ncbi:MAG: ADP-ribosylation factor-like protein [Promethearchaeota archaeon]